MSIDWNGFTVYKADILPPNTLMVSPDVYEKLTETPEQQAKRFDAMKAVVDRFDDLVKRRVPDAPKPNKDAPRPNIEVIR